MAGTRLYTSNAAATYTPPTIRGSWNDAALTAVTALTPNPSGAYNSVTRTETSTLSTWTVLLHRFVSAPINNAATLDGAVTLCMPVLEQDAAANFVTKVHMFVLVGSTDVVRGALTTVPATGVSEWPYPVYGSTGAGQAMTIASLASVAAQPGDRIVIEVGFKAVNTVSTSYFGAIGWGSTGVDLSDGDGNYSIHPGWVEFAGVGFASAFGPPFRSGQSTINLSMTRTQPNTRKKTSGLNSVALSLGTTEPNSHKKMANTVQLALDASTGAASRSATVVQDLPLGLVFDHEAEHISPGGTSVCQLDLDVISYASLEGAVTVHPPEIDLLPAVVNQTRTGRVRFIAQDIRTKVFLDYDLPLVDPVISRTLSGPTLIKANLKPEYTSISELGIEPDATWIHAERDGVLLATGILSEPEIDGEDYALVAEGFTSYPNDMQFMDEISVLWTDPLTIVRQIWDHLQSFPDAGLGVLVDQDAKTPIRLGIPAQHTRDPNTGELQYDETTTGDPVTAADTVTSTETDPSTQVITVTYSNGSVTTRKPRISKDQPYVIAWYTDTDCGREIDNLAKTAMFDYYEQVGWDASRSDTTRKLAIGYPRLGTRRTDLRCALDENMVEAFPLGSSKYASQVAVRGRGEGRAAVRGSAGGPDPHRVRRIVSVVDLTLAGTAAANSAAAEERARRTAALTIGEIHLRADHPNMPLGSYMCGDEVLVTGTIPYAGKVELWHRIISFDWYPDEDLVVAQTRRAEQFTYGRVYDPGPAPTAPQLPSGDDAGAGGTDTPARTYATPGEALQIGAGNKQNHFYLQHGSTIVQAAQIGSGYSKTPEFHLTDDRQWVRFQIGMNAPTTSNSTNPRSELREQDLGNKNIAFSSGWMQATVRFIKLPNKYRMCSALQVHDADSDSVQILTRVVGGKLNVMARINGKDNDADVLIPNYQLGQEFTCKIDVNGSACAISINGAVKLNKTLSHSSGFYFKAGCYPQRATSESSSDYAALDIRNLGHFHSGWPTPVFDSGSTGGGSSGAGRVVAFGSCVKASDSGAFDAIAKMNPDYFFFLGDFDYSVVSAASDGSTQERLWRAKMNAPNFKRAIAATKKKFKAIFSDHEGLDSNVTAGARFNAANLAYRRIFGSTGLPSQGIYETWDDGKVCFIALDCRTFKSPNAAADTSSKTMLGSTQKTWLRNKLSSTTAKLVIVLNDGPWSTPRLAGEDAWRGYDTERREVGGWFGSCKAPVVVIEGDSHSLAIAKNSFGVDRVYRAAPLHNETKVPGGGAGYEATYPANSGEGPVMEQFGILLINDVGNPHTVTYGGFSNGVVKLYDEFKF